MITFIFRKGSPTVFSVEKLFNSLYGYMENSGADMERLELPYVSTGIVSVLRNAWFVARRRRTKVLHITGDVHYAAVLCPFSRTIITIHDCVVLQRGTGFKRFVLWILWFGLPVRLASAIVVVSEQTKKELLETIKVPGEKIKVIPNFVDPGFEFNVRPFANNLPRILHVGTTANKNLARVVAALRGIKCVLVIVGELSNSVSEKLRANNIQYENFVGIDHAAMVRLYQNADIISFPSTYEGFGMPIIEGQSVGRPVLTSDLEPMRSISGNGGALLVNPLSVEAVREGIVKLIGDETVRTSLVAAGRINCRQYTLAAVAASYSAVYRQCGERVP